MKYAKLVAKNVQGVNPLIQELKRARFNVVEVYADPYAADNTTVFVLSTLRGTVEPAQALIRDYNGGAYCEPVHLTAAEFEAYTS